MGARGRRRIDVAFGRERVVPPRPEPSQDLPSSSMSDLQHGWRVGSSNLLPSLTAAVRRAGGRTGRYSVRGNPCQYAVNGMFPCQVPGLEMDS